LREKHEKMTGKRRKNEKKEDNGKRQGKLSIHKKKNFICIKDNDETIRKNARVRKVNTGKQQEGGEKFQEAWLATVT
jgi:hypothetical protein